MDAKKTKAMAERAFRDMAGGMAAGMAFIGHQCGLFEAMSGRGPVNAAELAESTGLVERYVEEWLRGMVAAEYLEYDPAAKTFELSQEHAYLLASNGTDHFMGGLFAMLPPLMEVVPSVCDAFRDGGGVAFSDYSSQCREAIDLMNRGNYEHRLVDYWLQQIPDTLERLSTGANVLDIGCGSGHVVAAIARAFPDANVLGIDPDKQSIARAQSLVDSAELGNARFISALLADLPADERFDLIMLCDCLHDLPDPVPVLRDASARLTEGGVLFVIEPRAADQLEDNIHPVATMLYGFSVMHCMTQSLASGGLGLGACLGPERTMALLGEGGFEDVRQLRIRSPVNLFYVASAPADPAQS